MARHSNLFYEILATCYRGQPWHGVTDDLAPDKHSKDKEFLDKYALERWEV
jgi:hypothetical protein